VVGWLRGGGFVVGVDEDEDEDVGGCIVDVWVLRGEGGGGWS